MPSGLLGAGSHQVFHDSSINVEKVIAGHSGLAGNTCRYHDHFGTLEAAFEFSLARMATDLYGGADVTNISVHAHVGNIIEG